MPLKAIIDEKTGENIIVKKIIAISSRILPHCGLPTHQKKEY